MTTPRYHATDRTIHILVVDDDPDMLGLLEAIVKAEFGDAAHIESVVNPREAKAALSAKEIDILLTDLQMPGIDGLKLLQHAKQCNPWTQVIIITGYSARDTVAEALTLGASDYLTKPLDPLVVQETLRAALARLLRWCQSLAKIAKR